MSDTQGIYEYTPIKDVITKYDKTATSAICKRENPYIIPIEPLIIWSNAKIREFNKGTFANIIKTNLYSVRTIKYAIDMNIDWNIW